MRGGTAVLLGKELVRRVKNDDLFGMSSQAAYSLIFALPPLLIFFTALSSVVARYTGVNPFNELLELARQTLPGSVYQTLEMVLESAREGGTGLLSVGFVLAIWGASGAINVMIKGFNRAYDVEEGRGFIKRKVLAIVLTIGLSVLVIVAFVLFVFGERLGRWLAGQAGLGETFSSAWNIGRWPVIIVFSMLSVALLYWIGPAVSRPFRWVSPGAILATLLWLGATYGFSIYLRISDPGNAYGALGALVVLLFFFYVSSLILLLGAEVDAAVEHAFGSRPISTAPAERTKRLTEAGSPAEEEIGFPPRRREPEHGSD